MPSIKAPVNVAIIATTKCTLNCKYCLNYQPYIQDRQHYAIEKLKRDVDLFFSVFTSVAHFSVSGGEPFLHPQLGELLQYIHEKYHDRIERLWVPTNCTIVPPDDLCNIFADCDIEIRGTVYAASTAVDALDEKLRRFGVKLYFSTTRFFITYPPLPGDKLEVHQHFAACRKAYSGSGIKDGRLYVCCYSMFADTAGICKAAESDSFDLMNPDLKALADLSKGYFTKGCVKFCHICNGWPPNNTHFDPLPT